MNGQFTAWEHIEPIFTFRSNIEYIWNIWNISIPVECGHQVPREDAMVTAPGNAECTSWCEHTIEKVVPDGPRTERLFIVLF